MTRGETPATQEALEHVLESTTVLFEALLDPFEALAETHPDATIGAPIEVPYIPRTSNVRTAAEAVTRGGRNGWSLYQVAERENQVKTFVRDYRRGLYRTTPAAEWVSMLRNFRDAILGDVHTALQAPRGWDRLDLANHTAPSASVGGDLLSPRDVAPELGLAERTVRRRIQDGKLGPWRKEGSRWVIGRDDFMRYWAGQFLDADVPRPPTERHTQAELDERLEHVRLRLG